MALGVPLGMAGEDNYKAGVEGIDGIDDQIQDAAGKIHEAQGEIARLEPMLHDVERAVNRMRTYVETITTECGTEEYLGHLYKDIQEKIVALQECPGRNDFVIDVPHWRPKRQITDGTPAPTPWYAVRGTARGTFRCIITYNHQHPGPKMTLRERESGNMF